MQYNHLLLFFKTMADETRLKMIGLLNERTYNVGELAAALELSESTVSHHLAKLREIGLINLSIRGNQRLCWTNDEMLRRLAEQTQELVTFKLNEVRPDDDTAWIEPLGLDEYDQKVLRDYTTSGRLRQIPAKEKKLLAVLRWLVQLFEPDRMYTEAEVNAIIEHAHHDYATLRRDLIDFGFLRRERGGGKYWLTPENETV